MVSGDWLARSRNEMLKMAQNWAAQIRLKGKLIWGISEEKIAEFEETVTNAETEYNRPEATRTASSNALLKNVFDKLAKDMRDIKRRYFLIPPLTEADFISLGLKPKDTSPTPVGIPIIRPQADVRYLSQGVLELTIKPAGEISDKRVYYGCKVNYEAFSINNEPPTSVRQLFESKFTKRKKEKFVFKSEDSGKKMYFALRYENSKGEAGEWSDIFSAVIP